LDNSLSKKIFKVENEKWMEIDTRNNGMDIFRETKERKTKNNIGGDGNRRR